MNFFKTYLSILIASFFILLISCKKDKEGVDGSNKTELRFKIAGVESPKVARTLHFIKGELEEVKKASNKSNQENPDEAWVSIYNGLDALTNFTEYSMDLESSNMKDRVNEIIKGPQISSTSPNKDQLQAAATPLPVGIKYRILVFNVDGDLVNESNNIFTVGSTASIMVEAGKTYTWVAYSLNDNTDPPAYDDSYDGEFNLLKEDFEGKDLLYTKSSGAVTPVSGENLLNITFKHHRIRYDIVLDPSGLFGPFTADTKVTLGKVPTPQSTTGFASIIKTADLNLLNGEYDNNITSDDTGILVSSMQNDVSCTNCKKFTFYTIDHTPIPANTLTLRFDNLKIEYPSASNPSDYGNNLLAKFTHVTFSPSFNNYYGIKAKLVSGYNLGDGLVWAPTNLYVEGGVYKFRPSNYYAANYSTDYFKWNALLPGPNGVMNSGDPCKEVLPKNTWKLPSASDYSTLSGKLSTTVQTEPGDLVVIGTSYAVKYSVPESSIYANLNDPLVLQYGKGLYFNYAGYIQNGGWNVIPSLSYIWVAPIMPLGSPFGIELLGLPAGVSWAQYWSSSGSGGSGGTASYYGASFTGAGISATVTAVLSSTNILNTVDGRHDGLLVRCVRPATTSP